jgi:hypothetical protein
MVIHLIHAGLKGVEFGVESVFDVQTPFRPESLTV